MNIIYDFTAHHRVLALKLANASGLCRPLDHSIPKAIMLSLLLPDLPTPDTAGFMKGLLLTGDKTGAGAEAG